jgi:hypothetical protein
MRNLDHVPSSGGKRRVQRPAVAFRDDSSVATLRPLNLTPFRRPRNLSSKGVVMQALGPWRDAPIRASASLNGLPRRQAPAAAS